MISAPAATSRGPALPRTLRSAGRLRPSPGAGRHRETGSPHRPRRPATARRKPRSAPAGPGPRTPGSTRVGCVGSRYHSGRARDDRSRGVCSWAGFRAGDAPLSAAPCGLLMTAGDGLITGGQVAPVT
ncbi:hypothetical protein G6F35_017429 [Rhizopus arrhizus]|nr:hypothetical protein G6F35_017429 [Rhizopus arrhizus]